MRPTQRVRRYGHLDEEREQPQPTGRRCYPWLMWTLLTLAQITTFFGTSSAVTFVIDPIMADLHLSRSLSSLSYAVGTGCGAVAQIPIGRLVDRHGGRTGVAVCSAAFYLSLLLMALPREWVLLTLAFTAMRALGFGGLALACNTCLQQWFVKRRGLATGLSESVNTLVGFGLCSQLYSSIVSAVEWRLSYVIVGLALMAYPPLAALLLRSRPEDVGMAPDGEELHAQPAVAGGGAPAAQRTADAPLVTGWTLREASRTAALWIIVAGNALMWGIGAGFFFHLASLVTEMGLPLALLPSCFYLPWASSRALSLVLGGYLLDKVQPRAVMFSGFALSGAVFVVFGWRGSTLTPGRTVAIAMAWGLSMGLGKATFAVCPAMFFGRKHLGSIQGLLQTTNVASTAVGPLLVAHDVIGSYSPIVLAIAAIYLFIGAVGALFLKAPRRTEPSSSSAEEAAQAADRDDGGVELEPAPKSQEPQAAAASETDDAEAAPATCAPGPAPS